MTLINSVRSYTSGTPGRCLNQVRSHHFVIDGAPHSGGPAEEITPADAFLSGVSACAVMLIEKLAQDEGLPAHGIECSIEGRRSESDTSVFEGIDLHVVTHGITRDAAERLVERFKGK